VINGLRVNIIWINLLSLILVLDTNWYLRTYLHILLHIESLTTTRPGFFWLPTSCTLYAHECSPENDESTQNIFYMKFIFCFSVICHECEWQKLFCEHDNFFFLLLLFLEKNLQSRKIDSRVNKLSSRK
jgi:hypothetical protein